MKSDATFACGVILIIWIIACAAPGIHMVAKKKQALETAKQELEQKVLIKKDDNRFVDTFIENIGKPEN